MARRSRFQALLANWQRLLFVDKPPDLGVNGSPAPAHAAWQLASEVWQAWAERFYPALTDAEFAAIAQARGNETAFSLVNSKPIEGTNYGDIVNGAVSNRYLYRLRTQSKGLAQSAAWGEVSVPKRALKTRPPRTPVFTKIEAGDREITLHWALNREADLKEYRLYRARRREELEDLRWWRDDPPDRQMTVIPDPRLKVENNEVVVPLAAAQIAEVLGVYRADEYQGVPEPPAGRQPFNYFRELVRSTTGIGSLSPDPILQPTVPNLRPDILSPRPGSIAYRVRLKRTTNGTAVVLVYRDAASAVQLLTYLNTNQGPIHVDKNLPGLTDCFYRLVALDNSGNTSARSMILRGQAFEKTAPIPPHLTLSQDTNTPAVTLHWKPEQGVNYMVQRFETGNMVWQRLTSWLPEGTVTYEDRSVRPGATYAYRLRARSAAGMLSTQHTEYKVSLP